MARGEEIIRSALRTGIGNGRLYRAVAADINFALPAIFKSVPRLYIHPPRRAIAILRRQGSREQRDIGSHARIENLAETGNTLRQQHAVDPVLQIGMLAANVGLPERILRDARRLG